MEETYSRPLALSSLRRLTRILGTALICVTFNFTLMNILPDAWQATLQNNLSWIDSISYEYFLLYGVLVAPAWETIFQALPAYILGKNPSRGRTISYLFLSAIPFSFVHSLGYSLLYAIILLPTAFLLAYTYFYFRQRNQMPYLMTAIVHGLINLFSYFLLLWVNI